MTAQSLVTRYPKLLSGLITMGIKEAEQPETNRELCGEGFVIYESAPYLLLPDLHDPLYSHRTNSDYRTAKSPEFYIGVRRIW